MTLSIVVTFRGPDWSWGLHLIDVDHSMGDLVRIVGKQGEAWGR